jgi:vacuolar fusion protein MON1
MSSLVSDKDDVIEAKNSDNNNDNKTQKQVNSGSNNNSASEDGSLNEVERKDQPPAESSVSMWEKEEKYFFILSDAGKPIFASTGEDTQDIIPLMGVASLIIARSNNTVRTLVAGDTTIVFLLREPLYLFMAAKTGETVAHLRRQLKYLYAQITFFLTTRPFNAMRKNPSYDIRPLLQGTKQSLLELVHTADRTPNLLLEAISILPLKASVRSSAQKIIKLEKQDELNYAILMCGYEIVALMQPKNNELHPSDLLLILNFVNTQNSLRKSETWMPLCLPNFNDAGCLYGYCSYLNGASDVSLMLITTGSNPDNFHNFQQVKTRIETSLNEQGVMRAISIAHQRPNVTTAELRVPQVFHFVYACKLAGLSQCCSVAFSLPYTTEDSQKKLLRRYQHVFHAAHGCMTRSGEPYTGGIIGNGIKDRNRRRRNVLVEQSNDRGHDQVMYDPNDIIIDKLPSEIVVGYVGEDIEAYFALSPLAEMDLVQSCLNKILRVMKREEKTLFFLEKNTW